MKTTVELIGLARDGDEEAREAAEEVTEETEEAEQDIKQYSCNRAFRSTGGHCYGMAVIGVRFP